MPVLRTDGRSVGQVITKFSGMGRFIYPRCSAGALRARSSAVSKNNPSEAFQSAYKQDHSTETALMRVHNDILTAIDNRRTVILLVLDPTAAFDTVDYDILLSRLQERFGITGKPLL